MNKFLAVDNGGYSTCVCDGLSTYIIPSGKGVYQSRKLVSRQGDHDYVLEVNGSKYMMGTLSSESRFPLEMYTDTKANTFYDLSVLLSVFLYGDIDNTVMVSVPISRHVQEEKEKIKDRLDGSWDILVNGKRKEFNINEILVAPETVSAFWVDSFRGKTRWLDWGSRTIGYGTTNFNLGDVKFIDKESGTFEKEGLNAKDIIDDEVGFLAEFVAGKLLAKWDSNDTVINIGGGVLKRGLVESMKDFFPKSRTVGNPQTYLVSGMYKLGQEVLRNESKQG